MQLKSDRLLGSDVQPGDLIVSFGGVQLRQTGTLRTYGIEDAAILKAALDRTAIQERRKRQYGVAIVGDIGMR